MLLFELDELEVSALTGEEGEEVLFQKDNQPGTERRA